MVSRRSAIGPGRRAAAVLAASATIAALTSAESAASARRPSTERMSTAPSGLPDAASITPSISADGRHVAFVSWALNLVPGTTIELPQVFVRDRVLRRTVLVSRSCRPGEVGLRRCSHGDVSVAANNWSFAASLSATGRFVAYRSFAGNLTEADAATCGVTDQTRQCDGVYVHDRDADANGTFDEAGSTSTTLVSISSSGGPANGSIGSRPDVSADGRFIAFTSAATNLDSGDTNSVEDVFVHDRDADQDGVFDEPGSLRTIRVSVALSGGELGGNSFAPSMSDDGTRVAFAADSRQDGDTDIFVHDAATGLTTKVTSSANAESRSPTVSADGRWVAFSSSATNLTDDATWATWPVGDGTTSPLLAGHCTRSVPLCGDRNQVEDVFVHDVASVRTFRVSGGYAGESNGPSRLPVVSADGRYVAFYSAASNLVRDDRNGVEDAFVWDRLTGTSALVSVSTAGGQGDQSTGASALCAPRQGFLPSNRLGCTPAISSDGAVIAFDSLASTLVEAPGQIDFEHIYVRDRGSCAPPGSAPQGRAAAVWRDLAEPERRHVPDRALDDDGGRPADVIFDVPCVFEVVE